jgi:hypothetical protein
MHRDPSACESEDDRRTFQDEKGGMIEGGLLFMDVQFILEPAAPVEGVADVMRSPTLRAISTMKSWTSWRLMSAMMSARAQSNGQ